MKKIEVNPYVIHHGKEPQDLDENSIIRFRFERHYVDISFDFRNGRDQIEIKSGSGRLSVLPMVSNVIQVEIIDI